MTRKRKKSANARTRKKQNDRRIRRGGTTKITNKNWSLLQFKGLRPVLRRNQTRVSWPLRSSARLSIVRRSRPSNTNSRTKPIRIGSQTFLWRKFPWFISCRLRVFSQSSVESKKGSLRDCKARGADLGKKDLFCTLVPATTAPTEVQRIRPLVPGCPGTRRSSYFLIT